jgi:hypothetical protein
LLGFKFAGRRSDAVRKKCQSKALANAIKLSFCHLKSRGETVSGSESSCLIWLWCARNRIVGAGPPAFGERSRWAELLFGEQARVKRNGFFSTLAVESDKFGECNLQSLAACAFLISRA